MLKMCGYKGCSHIFCCCFGIFGVLVFLGTLTRFYGSRQGVQLQWWLSCCNGTLSIARQALVLPTGSSIARLPGGSRVATSQCCNTCSRVAIARLPGSIARLPGGSGVATSLGRHRAGQEIG